MIHGHKPNGYFRTFDASGKAVEGETRQCVHCQKMWNYKPGSGTWRGWCLNCGGFLCGEPHCFAQQKTWTEEWLALTGKVRSCIPLEEWNARRIERLAHKFPLDPDLTITEAGVIVPRSLL